MPTVAIVIPTRNRRDSLRNALRSIARQTTAPLEIIIVDQSPGSADDATELVALCSPTEVNYIWDPTILGLTLARNRALEVTRGDIVLFLDDDITLYPDFVERLMAAYRELPDATGISGIPDNYQPPGTFFYWWSRIFTRGPFWNDRFPAYWNAQALKSPQRVTQMSGGMMSLQRARLGSVRFDGNLRGVSDGEDVDFCVRLAGTYYIDPRCRLTHHFDATGRERDHWTRRHARANTYLYLKNWRDHKLAYVWLNCGWALAATLASASRRSLQPVRSMLAGRVEGRQCLHPPQVN